MSLSTILQAYFTRPIPPESDPIIDLQVGTCDPHRDNTKFRLSDAGKCHLMRYWKRQGKPGKPFAGTTFALEAGNLFHAYVEHAVWVMKAMLCSEFELEDPHRLGHFDMLVDDAGVVTLYELKTVSGKKAYYKKKNDEPDRQHLFQVISYAEHYDGEREQLPPIDALRVAYLNRDDLEVFEYPVIYEKHLEAVTDDWNMLIDAWESECEPAPTAEAWECKYCQYQPACRAAK